MTNVYLEKIAEMNRAERAGYDSAAVIGTVSAGNLASSVTDHRVSERKVFNRLNKARGKHGYSRHFGAYGRKLGELGHDLGKNVRLSKGLGAAAVYAGALGAGGTAYRKLSSKD